jgi:hypothetical protein
MWPATAIGVAGFKRLLRRLPHSAQYTYFNCRIDQLFPCQLKNGRLEQGMLNGGHCVRNDYNEAGVQFHLAKEPNKVNAAVGDECDFILGDSVSRFPVRLSA